MNKVILIGRLTKDANISVANGHEEQFSVARFTLAVDRRGKDAGADFISCVAYRKTADFIEKYTHKGTKLAVTGRITTGSYTNRDGQKVYTTDVTVDECEFCESKAAAEPEQKSGIQLATADGFMEIPVEDDEGLPF